MSFKFFRKGDPYALPLSMAGVKLGDRVLQIGCGDGGLLAAMAKRVGLTGRACGVDEDQAAITRAEAAGRDEGALVEVQTVSLSMLPFADGSFDLVVLRDVLAHARADQRVGMLNEARRVLRHGGRCLVIEPAPRGGLGALFGPQANDPFYTPTNGAERALQAEGFRATRRLAEREGLAFIEGVKPPPV